MTHDLETRIAIDRGADCLDLMRKSLARAAAQIDQLQSRYAEVADPADMARIVSEAIQLLASGVLPNLRLELAADAFAGLSVAGSRARGQA